MRAPVIFLLSSGLILGAVCAPAEVIHLKNGRTIYADQVRENGAHLEYEVGEDSYAIPKAVVLRVEAGGVRPERSPSSDSQNSREIPAFTPADNLKGEFGLSDRLIRNGQVDTEALAALEQEGNAHTSAAGYFISGKHEMDHGNFSKARTFFETALRFESQNPTILNYYVSLLLRMGNTVEALPFAERAVRVAPDSPTPWPFWAMRSLPPTGIATPSAAGNGPWRCVPTRKCRNTWKKPSETRAPNQTLPKKRPTTLP